MLHSMHLTLIQIIWGAADLQNLDGVDYHHEKWKNTALAIVQQFWAWLHLVRDFTLFCAFFSYQMKSTSYTKPTQRSPIFFSLQDALILLVLCL